MADDDVIVLNQPGLTQRTSAGGKVRYTIEVKSEPLVHSFDPKTLGKVVAEAIAATLRKKMQEITDVAAPRTLKARLAAERAITKVSARAYGPLMPEKYGPAAPEVFGPQRRAPRMPNGAWANARYSGGRTGLKLPNQTNRAFNDSGRMAESIVAQAKDDEWVINVAANRLDPTTTTGDTGVMRIWRRLQDLVPAFGKPALLFEEKDVKDALTKSLESMITKAKETRDQLSEARARAMINVAKQAMGLLRMVA